jgi:radical SAM superfamily enzyme YgiQ (UPF0313 family)
MRVLLISFNRLAMPQRVAPVGALYLGASLRQRGHEVRLVDLMFSSSPERDLREAIRTFQPEVVGGSLRNVDTIVSKDRSFLGDYRDCLGVVRHETRAPLILGGAGFSNFPRETMQCLRPDFGMVGEADRSFPMFLDALGGGGKLEGIPGLVRWEGEELRFEPADRSQDLDEIPDQAIDLIDAHLYRRRRGYFGVLTRRSCTQRCVFCNESALHGPTVRLRSPGRVVAEIRALVAATGMRHFGFSDPLFNSPRQHMVEILEEIARQDLRIRLRVEVNPLGLDEESARLLKRAGCVGVDFAAESGSERMLGALGKGFGRQDVMRATALLVKHGIPYTMGFLLGGPGESLESLEETLQLARSLPRPKIVYFSVGLVILDGAPLANAPGAKLATKQPEDLIQVRYYLDPGFDERCAQRLLSACRAEPRFFLSESLFSSGLKPMWALADLLNFRSNWKHPFMARFMVRFLLGKGVPFWNPGQRRFIAERPARGSSLS